MGKVYTHPSNLSHIQQFQCLHSICESVAYCLCFLFLQSSFGKVTIQIDRVVMLGAVAGEYSLLPESKSGPRNLEIEFQWSNK